MSDIILLNEVEGELETNYAEFADEANSNYDEGVLNFGMPIYDDVSEKWYIHGIYGTKANGGSFEYGTLEVDEDFEDFEQNRLNPTKVFWFIVKKLKGVLCPTCM